jgi:CheY-like chemotaxis protein
LKELAGVRVLFVDDNVDMREVMALYLQTDGATVVVAGSAAEALDVLSRERVDVLVCDIGLPDMDGCALLQKIRALPPERGGAVPAIALTGYSGFEIRSRVLDAGYQSHVVKPVEPEQLSSLVASVADRGSSSTSSGG